MGRPPRLQSTLPERSAAVSFWCDPGLVATADRLFTGWLATRWLPLVHRGWYKLPRPPRVEKLVKKTVVISLLALSTLLIVFVVARAADRARRINLPTSKTMTLPVPGYLARTNSFPATIALSPDGRYAALLNQGYGTQATGARQSIALLDLSNNQLHDFPDDRLSDEYSTHQSYFIGLAFSIYGKTPYASMGSITDPTAEKPNITANALALYNFAYRQF